MTFNNQNKSEMALGDEKTEIHGQAYKRLFLRAYEIISYTER